MNRYDLKASPSSANSERVRNIKKYYDALTTEAEINIKAAVKAFDQNPETQYYQLDKDSFSYLRLSDMVYVSFNVIDTWESLRPSYRIYLLLEACNDLTHISVATKVTIMDAKKEAQKPSDYERAVERVNKDLERMRANNVSGFKEATTEPRRGSVQDQGTKANHSVAYGKWDDF